MKRVTAVFFVVSVMFAMSVTPASAQIFNQPVYHNPGHGTGVTLAADIGIGANDDAKKLVPGETPVGYGGHITLGLPVVTITAGLSVVDPKGPRDTEVAVGGNLALTLFKAPMTPIVVDLQAGLGYVKFDAAGGFPELKVIDVPIGVGLGINVPNPSVSFEPWIAPRIHVRNVRTTGLTFLSTGSDETKVGFGVSGGFNLGLPMGLGFHAAVDWMTIDNVMGTSESPVVFGFGINYKFNVPSLGLPGGVL